jgi:hypothetical protein
MPQEVHAVGVADLTNQLPRNARGHLEHETGRDRIIGGDGSERPPPKPASGVYIDR